jgi:hypothetical protein
LKRAGDKHLTARVDKRTRSTLVSGFRYALAYKSHSEPLDEFIERKGGINEYVGGFSKRLGRSRPNFPSLMSCAFRWTMSQKRKRNPVKYVMTVGLDN